MIHFVYNPKSGQGKVKRTLKKLTAYCTKKRVPYAVHPTEYAGHCPALIAQLESEGADTFAILGGDGTFHEALNGITDFEHTKLLLLPCGSGNDFAACDKRLSAPPMTLLKHALEGHTRKIDYIQFANGKRCINIAGAGLDTEVLLKARAMRRLTGNPRYLAALRRVLKNFHPYEIDVTVGGETKHYSALLVGVCNGARIGGGICVSPKSKIDDGKLRLMIFTMPYKDNVWRILPQFVLGHHSEKYYSHEFLVDEVKVSTDRVIELDGEIYKMDFDCKLVPGGLTIYC